MKTTTITERVLAVGSFTLKAYLILSAVMFVGGLVIGAALAAAGYALPSPF